MGIQSKVAFGDTKRLGRVRRGARVLAPLLLLVAAFGGCSAGELEADMANAEAAPIAEEEGLESSSELELGTEGAHEDAELLEEAELELGQLAQPLVNGAPCVRGTVACLNSSTAQTCVNGRVVSFPCPGQSSCRNGQCVANQVCTPNAALGCSGSSRVMCNAAGTGSVLAACAAGTTCSGTGQCVPLPRICTPNTRSCSGNTLLTCNAQGTALTSRPCNGGVCSPTVGCIIIR